jgi:hypothetical protein
LFSREVKKEKTRNKAKAKMSWLRGVVKEVPSGDTVVVVAGGAKPGQVPAEKRITLSSLVAPKLVRKREKRGSVDGR